MDSSLSSSINKSVASKVLKTYIDQDDNEESGWTSYFEDFLSNQRREQTSSSSSSSSYTSFNINNSTTLISDAASYVHWKVSNKNKVSSVNNLPKFSKKLNFLNQTRAKELYYDDSLEDTASSPVNSPKVGSLKEMDMDMDMDMNQRNKNDLGKGIDEERVEKRVFEGKDDNECQELRKTQTQLFWLIS